MSAVELTDVGIFGVMGRYGDLCIHAVIDLRRTFSRDELERAMAKTLADFPVLDHRYAPGRWRDRWVRVTGPVSDFVHLLPVEDRAEEEKQTDAWLRRSLDVTRQRPLRLVALVRAGGTGMRIVLTLSHLAVDGAGIAAVGHVFGSHLYGVAPAVPVDRRRDVRRTLDGLAWYHLPFLARDIVKVALQPLRHLAAARRTRAYGIGDRARTAWRHIAIGETELARIKAACPGAASVNDVLVAAVARVAAGRSSDRSVVVTYTMDLRRYGKAARLTATNGSGLLSAIVPRQAMTSLAASARAVAEITAGHRRSLAGPAFLLGPYVIATGLPHGTVRGLLRLLSPLLVDLPLSRGLLVTNVGRLDDGLRAFGDDIETIRIVGPNVDKLPVPVVVAFGFRGALHIDLFAPVGLGEAALDDLERELFAALERERDHGS